MSQAKGRSVYRWLALGALVALGLAAFLLGEFTLVSPHGEVAANGTPYFVGLRAGEKLPMAEVLGLEVEGSGPLGSALADHLAQILPRETGHGRVMPTSQMTESIKAPRMRVYVAKKSGFWTPIYARSKLKLTAAYASDGDVSWLESGEPVLTASADPVARVRIELDASFRAAGLQSRRGYYAAVGAALAEALGNELGSELATH